MEFVKFNEIMQHHIKTNMTNKDHLFVVDVDNDELWNMYLKSFPVGTNNLFRVRREHDCSCCRHYIKTIGNVVSIKNNKITTIWDFDTNGSLFQHVIDKMSLFIKTHAVSGVFITAANSIGTSKSTEQTKDGGKIEWNHFFTKIPNTLKYTGTKTIDSIIGEYQDIRNVFKRSLEEITEDSIITILDLISQKSLYKGDEWKNVLDTFLKLFKEYHNNFELDKQLFCWEKSVEVGPVISKIKNHSIGTLLINVSNGIDLNEAVKKYEAIVAPTNYKRPNDIFTKKMIENAEHTTSGLGMINSLGRRFANIDDITINNIIFANRDSMNIINENIFDSLKESTYINPKNFNKIEEVSIDNFISEVIPTVKKIEIMFENKHSNNMVSLIAPKIKDSPSMFKWSNGFSWAYSGNITDSMKDRVKSAGGKVDGALRFSLQWNDNRDNNNDFDAHCKEPTGEHIYYGNKRSESGELDVDIINPNGNIAVENITWQNINRMPEGKYNFFVHNFCHTGGRSGFAAEIEFNGQIYSFKYNKELRNKEIVKVATVEYNKNTGFKINELLPSSLSSIDIWGINTNKFHPVNIFMYSPNYWDGQTRIGNKHYLFMIDRCINTERPNGFFNEFLNLDLIKHKRVFEALGSKMRVEDSINQLSGIGFSSTIRNSFICKVEGSFNRILKIII